MRRACILALCLSCLSGPAWAEPPSQLSRSVAVRLAPYGIRIDPGLLTTAQAAALHLALATEGSYFDKKRRLRQILSEPRYRD